MIFVVVRSRWYCLLLLHPRVCLRNLGRRVRILGVYLRLGLLFILNLRLLFPLAPPYG